MSTISITTSYPFKATPSPVLPASTGVVAPATAIESKSNDIAVATLVNPFDPQHLSSCPELKFLKLTAIEEICTLAKTYLKFPSNVPFINLIKNKHPLLPKTHLFFHQALNLVKFYLKLPAANSQIGSLKKFTHAICVTFSDKSIPKVQRVARLTVSITSENELERIKNEVHYLLKFKGNPRICQLQNYAEYVGKNSQKKFVLYEDLYLADLSTFCKDRLNQLPSDQRRPLVKRLIIEILEGLNNLHEIGIVHCDLKPRNIFIDDNFHPFISDFEYAIAQSKITDILQGTPAYISPEKIHRIKAGIPLDIWAAGCIFHELHHGKRSRVMQLTNEALKFHFNVQRLPKLIKQPCTPDFTTSLEALEKELHPPSGVSLEESKKKPLGANLQAGNINGVINKLAQLVFVLNKNNEKKQEPQKDSDFPKTIRNTLKKMRLESFAALECEYKAMQAEACPKDFIEAMIWKMTRIIAAERVTTHVALKELTSN